MAAQGKERKRREEKGADLTGEYVLEGHLYIARVQRRSLDKGQVILRCVAGRQKSAKCSLAASVVALTGKALGIFGRHSPQMSQIALVSH